MLTEICDYLKNWFDDNQPKYIGSITITDGIINYPGMSILPGQYFRIIGSVFNDGVWKFGTDTLVDESFSGAVWPMSIPKDLVSLAEEIREWNDTNGKATSQNMSPFTSESFGGYSYTKSNGGQTPGDIASGNTWNAAFKNRLIRWKRI